jgi:hypothetical protein
MTKKGGHESGTTTRDAREKGGKEARGIGTDHIYKYEKKVYICGLLYELPT